MLEFRAWGLGNFNQNKFLKKVKSYAMSIGSANKREVLSYSHCVDADSGLVHTVVGTAANVYDITQLHQQLHGEETVVFADAGYQGADKRLEAMDMYWQVAMRPGKRRAQKHTPWGALIDQAEKIKSSVRDKVEHAFRVVECQFGYTKVRYRGLVKNTAQMVTLFVHCLTFGWLERHLCRGCCRHRCA